MSNSRLAYWRERRGLTQEQLAGMAGATQPAVSEMERAKRAPKGLYTALRLAAALRVPVTAIWPDAVPQRLPILLPSAARAKRQRPSPKSAKTLGKSKA